MSFHLLKWKIMPLCSNGSNHCRRSVQRESVQRKGEQEHEKTKRHSTAQLPSQRYQHDKLNYMWRLTRDCFDSTKEVQGGKPTASPCLCCLSQQLQGAQNPACKASCPQGWARGSGCVSSPAVCPSQQQLQPALGPGRARPWRQVKKETAHSALKFLPVPDLSPTGIHSTSNAKPAFASPAGTGFLANTPSFLTRSMYCCCIPSCPLRKSMWPWDIQISDVKSSSAAGKGLAQLTFFPTVCMASLAQCDFMSLGCSSAPAEPK